MREWLGEDDQDFVDGFGVGLLAGCKTLPPPMPLEQLNAQQMQGHAVFQARCAQCHYDRKDKPLHGPPMLACSSGLRCRAELRRMMSA